MAYSDSAKSEAKDLYTARLLSMEEVSERTGVPESTLYKWSNSYDWTAERKENIKKDVNPSKVFRETKFNFLATMNEINRKADENNGIYKDSELKSLKEISNLQDKLFKEAQKIEYTKDILFEFALYVNAVDASALGLIRDLIDGFSQSRGIE